jgi:hypothetical protein
MKGKEKAAFQVLLLGLGLILAACGGGAGVPTDNASVGTNNWSDTNPPGVAWVLAANPPQTSTPDGFDTVLKDPDGNTVFSYKVRISVKSTIFSWALSTAPAKSGTYSGIVDWPWGSKTYKIPVDPSKVLGRPNPRLTASTTSATISWAPVSGAKAYYVALWQTDAQGSSRIRFVEGWNTNQTSVQFNQLNLPQGTYYRAWVYAFEADLVDPYNLPAQLGKQVNVSVRSTSVFQVQSLGTLRILDHLPDDVPPPDMER